MSVFRFGNQPGGPQRNIGDMAIRERKRELILKSITIYRLDDYLDRKISEKAGWLDCDNL
jgi:hypothetical protein